MKRKLQSIGTRRILFVGIFVFVGVLAVILTRAASPTSHFEAESAGGLATGSDASASGGSYLQFGSGALPPTPGGTTMRSSISQWGITWTFDKNYPTGQFVNGDYWVIGPVRVTSITKPHGTSGHDGSMINPKPLTQAYDQQNVRYNAALDVSTRLPLTINANSSLVSTVTWVPGDPGAPAVNTTANAPRPTGRKASVLTVLSGAPPADAFRPPYAGTEKPIYRFSQLNKGLLPNRAAPSGTPSASSLIPRIQKVWLDHNPEWNGAYSIPSENAEHYGREMTMISNDAALFLMTNAAGKDDILKYYIQIGIDNYGALKNGMYWGTWGGGWGGGRKVPILVAGILLNNAPMKNIGSDYVQTSSCSDKSNPTGCQRFAEDCHTFYLNGKPAWNDRHCGRNDNTFSNSGYRFCCTSSGYTGGALVAMMLKDANGVSMRSLWKWEAYFDYEDYWVQSQGVDTTGQNPTFISPFARSMWKAYRAGL